MTAPYATTMPDRWRALADEDPDFVAIVHYAAADPPVRWTRRALIERAEAFARLLLDDGVRKGDVCALILKHHPDVYPLYMAVAMLGAIPAFLAYPNVRIHPEKYRQGLAGMVARSGLDWILTSKDLAPAIEPLLAASGGAVRGLLFPLERPLASQRQLPGLAIDSESPLLLQHSSGTTGLQKAVMLSHRAVLEHVQRYGNAIAASSADKVVSWLPLYHDMGLIAAFHLPLALGVSVVQMDPFEWVAAPVLLLEVITTERATLCWLPNFAYNLIASRVRDEDLGDFDLSSMRMFINCSEPVRSESHSMFSNRLASVGVTPSKLGASYAMAETTFAVTQTLPGQKTPELSVDREALARGEVRLSNATAGVRVCVSSGRTIAGCLVRVIGDDGLEQRADRVGELLVTSVSMSDGYRNWPEKTEEAFRDGWYRTGDVGFVRDGEVFVIGRKKDLIIVAGKNIYPEDIEDAVSGVDGVLQGRVVAFGMEDDELGTEQIAVIAESAAPEANHAELVARIKRAGAEIDVTVARVFIVPPRWLIKSSSGKPSRSANRSRITSEAVTGKVHG